MGRAGGAIADLAAVDLDHGDDFHRGAGQKALVGNVDVVLAQGDFAHVDARRASQLHHRFAGDARADFNGSATVTVQDIFDFLAAYFAGCS